MKTHRIAVLAGDGIGKEVIPTGIEVLKAAASREGFALELATFPWGCDFYLKNGRMMDADAVEHRQPKRKQPRLRGAVSVR